MPVELALGLSLWVATQLVRLSTLLLPGVEAYGPRSPSAYRGSVVMFAGRRHCCAVGTYLIPGGVTICVGFRCLFTPTLVIPWAGNMDWCTGLRTYHHYLSHALVLDVLSVIPGDFASFNFVKNSVAPFSDRRPWTVHCVLAYLT